MSSTYTSMIMVYVEVTRVKRDGSHLLDVKPALKNLDLALQTRPWAHA